MTDDPGGVQNAAEPLRDEIARLRDMWAQSQLELADERIANDALRARVAELERAHKRASVDAEDADAAYRMAKAELASAEARVARHDLLMHCMCNGDYGCATCQAKADAYAAAVRAEQKKRSEQDASDAIGLTYRALVSLPQGQTPEQVRNAYRSAVAAAIREGT